jgi:hypothetical protein
VYQIIFTVSIKCGPIELCALYEDFSLLQVVFILYLKFYRLSLSPSDLGLSVLALSISSATDQMRLCWLLVTGSFIGLDELELFIVFEREVAAETVRGGMLDTGRRMWFINSC